MRAKPPGCFFVGAIERAAVHPGGHAVELLPHLCGDDDVNNENDDEMVIILTMMMMMFSCCLTLEPVARHRESDLVKEWQERPAEL